MSLPSVPFLKNQANRLVAYLGDKHRFRLKASSALEAVAAMYRHHDWNTLQGLASREAEAPLPAGAQQERPARYPVSWTAGHEPDLTVSEADWFRHTLADGGTAAERREWLQLHLMEHVERGTPGVFINGFGGEKTRVRGIYQGLEQKEKGLPANDLELNLLADMAPEVVAATLVAIAPVPGVQVDFWKQKSLHVVTLAARAAPTTGQRVTLQGLAAHLQLPEADAPLGLAEALTQLSQTEWAPSLFSEQADAPGLLSKLAQGECLTFDWPERSNGEAGVAVLYAMQNALRERYGIARDWVFALGEVTGRSQMPGYVAPPLTAMAAQARGSRTALLMTAQDRNDLAVRPAGRAVLANVWNTLHLRGCSQARMAELLAQLEGQPLLVQPGRLIIGSRLR